MQPINSRLLIKIETTEYKHVPIVSSKQHENSVSVGVVVSVAPDADEAIKQLYYRDKIKGYVKPSDLIGKTVRWPKYAEQNTMFDGEDDAGNKIKLTLLEYKDLIGYEK